jgi:hypothetical protein
MNQNAAISMLLLSSMVGCSSSKPAPKPFKWDSDTSSQQAEPVGRKTEADPACSPENLRNATEAQKRKCDPTRDMFDNVRPQPQSHPPPQRPPKPQKRSDR